jgi:ABC-type bacteriocin/lantibiotic exporter with double-glycine peptidase domain
MKLTWFEQETPTSCVAACVRMVLSGFGQNYSEAKLREILGDSILGLTLTATQRKLSEIGAQVELDNELNLDDLRDLTRQNKFPIVGVERHILGYLPASHAVVVIEITSQSVSILDPLEGKNELIFQRKTFETAWKLSGKEALIIHSFPKSKIV